MTQADRVHSTPPLHALIDTKHSNFIAQVAAVTAAGGALGMSLPFPLPTEAPVKLECFTRMVDSKGRKG